MNIILIIILSIIFFQILYKFSFVLLKKKNNSYEQLVRYYPEIDNYKLYYAQSLQKSGQYQAALKACLNIENPELNQKVYIIIK